ncbi:hypothetical protein [Nodosilinea sp. FACHB-13]|uniref:hypothetical protein n=1 Tax=Cyanophyceae TaxID=3028117 RepID=UPI0016860E56|nr:hypothetical protein [Nodosilinea sp. FACHB-13]MBD2107915.1 hypothetical protein [Nodosilinea sp. FACHB-13]
MSLFLRSRSSAALPLGAAVLALTFACQPVPSADHSSAINKIAFDLSSLDENGLFGPADGKRSLDYEFCIPAGGAYTQAVGAIDPSAQFFPQSRGRIGCGEGEVLTIGNTYQTNYQDILIELANLNYIDRIQLVDWE